MGKITELLKTDAERRDEKWENDFLSALPDAPVKILSPEPREGPDHWPYLMVSIGEDSATESLRDVLGWLSTRGVGLVINPENEIPDFVLTYGMIWNFRERGEFLTKQESETANPAGKFEVKPGQEVLTGVPSAAYLPAYVRSVIKQFLADQGVFTPKILMVSFDKTNFDLALSIESLKSPPAHEHANIAEALSWFLPAHYSLALVSEKTIPGFVPLTT
jgi:hypothetical protein